MRKTLAYATLAVMLATTAQAQQARPYAPAGPAPGIELPPRQAQAGFPATARTLPAPPAPTARSAPDTPPAQPDRPVTPAPSPEAGSRQQAQRYAPGMVVSGTARVIDGHTLLVGRHSVRLDGADAPGRAQTCTSASGTAWRCGQSAYARLDALVGGANVSCAVTVPSGHGAAAICSARGIDDVAGIMVREGLAVPNGHDRGRYGRDAHQAMNGGAGLWAGRFDPPGTWRERNE